MAAGEVLCRWREAQGVTQEEAARRLGVTTACVDRWERGISEPGVDMAKLICATFAIPTSDMFQLPEGEFCQSCGMPLGPETYGTEVDGTPSHQYCQWCYEDGAFIDDIGLEELVEGSSRFMAQSAGITQDEAISLMMTTLPRLKRWGGPGE